MVNQTYSQAHTHMIDLHVKQLYTIAVQQKKQEATATTMITMLQLSTEKCNRRVILHQIAPFRNGIFNKKPLFRHGFSSFTWASLPILVYVRWCAGGFCVYF